MYQQIVKQVAAERVAGAGCGARPSNPTSTIPRSRSDVLGLWPSALLSGERPGQALAGWSSGRRPASRWCGARTGRRQTRRRPSGPGRHVGVGVGQQRRASLAAGGFCYPHSEPEMPIPEHLALHMIMPWHLPTGFPRVPRVRCSVLVCGCAASRGCRACGAWSWSAGCTLCVGAIRAVALVSVAGTARLLLDRACGAALGSRVVRCSRGRCACDLPAAEAACGSPEREAGACVTTGWQGGAPAPTGARGSCGA